MLRICHYSPPRWVVVLVDGRIVEAITINPSADIQRINGYPYGEAAGDWMRLQKSDAPPTTAAMRFAHSNAYLWVPETGRYVLETTRYILDPTRPIFDPTRHILDTTRYILDPTRHIFDLTRYILDPTRYILDIARYIFDPTCCFLDMTQYLLRFSRLWREICHSEPVGRAEGLYL